MLKLTEVTIEKYKSFTETQKFSVDPKITTLVGMNEAGKSAILEAIAKTNYFEKNDPDFIFNPQLDYPIRNYKEYKKLKSEEIAAKLKYSISNKLISNINEDLGIDLFFETEITSITYYDNDEIFLGFDLDLKKFLEHKFSEITTNKEEIIEDLLEIEEPEELDQLISQLCDENINIDVETGTDDRTEEERDVVLLKNILTDLKKYFENLLEYNNPLEGYIIKKWITPNIPKYLYYSEYYALPSSINLHELQSDTLDDESIKTSKALLELADVNLNEILQNDNHDSYITEIETTSNEITEKVFKYWKTNQDLRVKFSIDPKLKNGELIKYLNVRIEDQKHHISLPLKSRSKGFNWFFSFIVWFSKIQEDKNSKYVLLLDEPGLNLHAAAQADLLEYIENLSDNYQIIYTTHSPFMIDSQHLDRVRTIVETNKGSLISDSIQEKDSNTLFPLQAALGYDIAQNLFISKKNLLVEGPADLIYLEVMSSILKENNKEGLKDGITIVPVGGLDKVSTFISLLRGNKLEIVCLLDSFNDQKSKAKTDDLIKDKIIKDKNIRFFDEFTLPKIDKADIEDLFEEDEYLRLYNSAFHEYEDIQIEDLKNEEKRMINKISKYLGNKRFNHYRPAKELLKLGTDIKFFSPNTIDRFESMFKEVNKLFK